MIEQNIIKFLKPTFIKVMFFLIVFFISFFVFTVSVCPSGWICEFPEKFNRGFPSAFYSWNEYAKPGQPGIFFGNESGNEVNISYYAIAFNAVAWYLFSSVMIFVYDKIKK